MRLEARRGPGARPGQDKAGSLAGGRPRGESSALPVPTAASTSATACSDSRCLSIRPPRARPRRLLRFSVGDALARPPRSARAQRPRDSARRYVSSLRPARPRPAPALTTMLRPAPSTSRRTPPACRRSFPARLPNTCAFQGPTAPNRHSVPSLLPLSRRPLYIRPLLSSFCPPVSPSPAPPWVIPTQSPTPTTPPSPSPTPSSHR